MENMILHLKNCYTGGIQHQSNWYQRFIEHIRKAFQMSADSHTAEYPVFNDEVSSRMHYIEGYDPVSYMAPHSSLQRTSTWVGMGLVLTSLAGIGTIIFGAATKIYQTQEQAMLYLGIGVVIAAACLIAGFGMINYGRRYYRQYRAETGRIN